MITAHVRPPYSLFEGMDEEMRFVFFVFMDIKWNQVYFRG